MPNVQLHRFQLQQPSVTDGVFSERKNVEQLLPERLHIKEEPEMLSEGQELKQLCEQQETNSAACPVKCEDEDEEEKPQASQLHWRQLTEINIKEEPSTFSLNELMTRQNVGISSKGPEAAQNPDPSSLAPLGPDGPETDSSQFEHSREDDKDNEDCWQKPLSESESETKADLEATSKKRKLSNNNTTSRMTAIERIKTFSQLSFEEKRELLKVGRPTPELPALQQRKGQKVVRTFHSEWYKRKEWLCGCASLNRLFCFPCLLFDGCGTANKVWTNAGYCDLNNLPCAIAKHAMSVTHIQSQIALKTFGQSRIHLALDEQRQLGVSMHNEKVRKNREILKSLIDVVCFLSKQELAFRGNNEVESSSNRGNYIKLLHLLAGKDGDLASHLASSTVFSDTSNRIQNDLLEAIAHVLRDDIKDEVSAAQFVAVEVDETTDITNKAQLSVILRYVSGSEVTEAFLGFDEVGDDRRATAIANYVFGVLDEFNCEQKLVAQTYDGAAVTASHLNGVQAKIREKVPQAMFTHCYGHKLNLVLSQSARVIPECRVFFKTVEGLAAYFSKSTKCSKLLDDVVKRRSSHAAATRWNSNSRLVQTILSNHADLCEVFNHIQENPDEWDGQALAMASGFRLWLSKASTCFLLMVYSTIFTETDALFRVLQAKVMDKGFCSLRVGDTMKTLKNQRESFDSFYDGFQERCEALNLIDGNTRSKQPAPEERRKLFHSILDDIGLQMEARFQNLRELDFLALVDCKKFHDLSAHFDEAKLHSLNKYSKHFDFFRLKADLMGLYSSQVIKNKSPQQLLTFLVENDLEQTVPEATKLLRLVLTIPATTATAERSFSALKRIKTYILNRTEQEKLSSLALISIEKERLLKLKAKTTDFYTAVIDIFVQKDRRMDFIFK